MSRFPRLALCTALAVCGTALAARPAVAAPDFPVPSTYPISWQLNFKHGLPKRIAVDVPGQTAPSAYWYMTYTVTNDGDKEQRFYPEIDLVTDDGKVHAADQNIPARVFDRIRASERSPFLEAFTTINGPVRLGPAESRDAVAIWSETNPRMGHFEIYVAGLSGESVTMKMVDGKLTKVTQAADMSDRAALTILRKTLQLNFFIRGDEVYPGEDEVNVDSEAWVMR